MRSTKLFQTIWLINAVVIFLCATGLCLFLGYLAADALATRFALRERADTVNVGQRDDDAGDPKMWLGDFARLAGTEHMCAALMSSQSHSAGLFSKEASETRNYLFLNIEDKSSRWLMPTNGQLLLSMDEIVEKGMNRSVRSEDEVVKWLVFEVVPADTDGDRQLTAGDEKSLAVASPDGTHCVEVIKGVDEFKGQANSGGGKLVVVYRQGTKTIVAEVNLDQRSVTGSKELQPPQ
ncbi:MAG: hypothetical protein IH602_20895 [Bryobacteraceae bacterium]|nr:hypothetical protein [Bryobacteraceae bacterium]